MVSDIRRKFEAEMIDRDLSGQPVESIAISMTRRYAIVVTKQEIRDVLARK